MAPVLVGVTVLVFGLIHLTPGDPVQLIMGAEYTPERAEVLRQELNLDQPLYTQYFTWLGNVVTGDLGTSLYTAQPVVDLLLERIPITLQLAFGGLLFGVLTGVPMGVLAAIRQGTLVDQVTRVIALVGVAMPVYWLGLLLIEYLAVQLALFPAGGSPRTYGISALILPCFAIGVTFSGIVARTTRSSVLECLGESYVDTARAKGIPGRRVLWMHAVRNALIPVMTVIGLQFGTLLGGAVITETIFSVPGIGELLIQSISQRDFPIMQGCVLVIAVSFVLVNFVTDVSYSVADPRIRQD